MSDRKRRGKPVNEVATTERRRIAQRYQKRRDELMEEVLLGLDDGTPEAALNEEICFDKFLDDIDEDFKGQQERQKLLEQDAPILEEQKKFREKLAGLKIWR